MENTKIDEVVPGNPRASTSPQRRRVLLAEDDPVLRRLVASVLTRDGYEVIEACDGVELLANIERALACRRDRSTSFVIVADIHMPELSGLDVLSILRCAYATTPVILITAFGDRETYAEALELGASAVFDKPFDLDELRAAVGEAAPPWR
jgi:CheY-like chemotaxis protein